MSVALLRLPEVMKRTGFGRSSIYAYEKQGLFPQRVKLGARSVAWKEADVDAWIAARPLTCAKQAPLPFEEGGAA